VQVCLKSYGRTLSTPGPLKCSMVLAIVTILSGVQLRSTMKLGCLLLSHHASWPSFSSRGHAAIHHSDNFCRPIATFQFLIFLDYPSYFFFIASFGSQFMLCITRGCLANPDYN
jgi:hypothetical protein